MRKPNPSGSQSPDMKRRCHRCHGTGRVPCTICGGKGEVPRGVVNRDVVNDPRWQAKLEALKKKFG